MVAYRWNDLGIRINIVEKLRVATKLDVLNNVLDTRINLKMLNFAAQKYSLYAAHII